MAEVEVSFVHVAEHRDEKMPLRLAEVSYKRYSTPSTNLHGILSLVAQSCIISVKICVGIGPEIPEDEFE